MPESKKPFDKDMGMIPDDALRAILSAYGYASADWSVLPFLDVGDGIIATTRRSETASKAVVETDRGRLLVKQLPWYLPGREAVEFVSEFQATVAQRGVPAPGVLETEAGEYVTAFDGEYYHVQEFLTPAAVPESRRHGSPARLLAALHREARTMDELGRFREYREFCYDQAGDITAVLADLVESAGEDRRVEDRESVVAYRESVESRLERIERRLEGMGYGDDPRPVHGDFNPTNVLSSDGTVYAIVDFDNACFGRPEHDVAEMVLTHALFSYRDNSAIFDRPPGRFDKGYAGTLLEQYVAENPGSIDRSALPLVAEAIYYELCSLGLARGDFAFADAPALFERGESVRRTCSRVAGSVRE